MAKWDVDGQGREGDRVPHGRVLLQDFTGVPAVVDLAAMRDAIATLGGDPQRINPLQPVDLVIDHSVQVDEYGIAGRVPHQHRARVRAQHRALRLPALGPGRVQELPRRAAGHRHLPPGEPRVPRQDRVRERGERRDDRVSRFARRHRLAHDDDQRPRRARLGRRRHRGRSGDARPAGVDAHPRSRRLQAARQAAAGRDGDGSRAHRAPRCCARRRSSESSSSSTAAGSRSLPLADRATIANMAPEYGATMGFFPVDAETLKYLRLSGRSEQHVALVEAYTKEQGLFRTDATPDPSSPTRSSSTSAPSSRASPDRSARRIACRSRSRRRCTTTRSRPISRSSARRPAAAQLKKATAVSRRAGARAGGGARRAGRRGRARRREGRVQRPDVHAAPRRGRHRGDHELHEHVEPVRDARRGPARAERGGEGTQAKPWVKTSLAPGSKVVTDYLDARPACRSTSTSSASSSSATAARRASATRVRCPSRSRRRSRAASWSSRAVLSGNRNFEGRVNPLTRFNYLASPPLVVAYALAGRMDLDLTREPLGIGTDGPVFLRDIWPTPQEVAGRSRCAA